MSGLKKHLPDIRFSANRVTPDEIDSYRVYNVIYPTTSATWFGTAAAGTSTQAKALVVINAFSDAVAGRNLSGQVAGSSDMGGVWVVNGKNQFGESITETITVGTATNGGTTAGTLVFAQVLSGTFTFATGAVGSGTPKLGVDTKKETIKFGLPDMIASTADVKSITWTKEFVATTLNGGTIGSYVSTATHSFSGSADIAGTQVFSVLYRPSKDLSDYNFEYQAKL